MYSYNFLITIRITYEELCIKFSSILIWPKKCYRHFKKKFQKNFKFQLSINSSKKSKIFENLTVYR
ncbi:hypothetical protein FWK35_00001122 [Aphis craccivora]|uniref:Uncharacterized protein n=1 Tax=Aphis craccivora TaxID=307492 RepID=A0A6G0ZKR3_APHCR|nr:hypothetical protein FWK35_00001122 [Aphis craccivora]